MLYTVAEYEMNHKNVYYFPELKPLYFKNDSIRDHELRGKWTIVEILTIFQRVQWTLSMVTLNLFQTQKGRCHASGHGVPYAGEVFHMLCDR